MTRHRCDEQALGPLASCSFETILCILGINITLFKDISTEQSPTQIIAQREPENLAEVCE